MGFVNNIHPANPTINGETYASRNSDGTYDVTVRVDLVYWNGSSSDDTRYGYDIDAKIGDGAWTLIKPSSVSQWRSPANWHGQTDTNHGVYTWHNLPAGSSSTLYFESGASRGSQYGCGCSSFSTVSIEYPVPPRYNVNINVMHPDGYESYDVGKFTLTANGNTWNNLTDQPGGLTVEEGQSINISNVESLHGEMYTYSSGAGSYTIWGDTTIEIKFVWTKHWVDINGYQPNNSSQGAFLFDVIVYNRSGNEVKRWTNLTDQPSDFTFEYGYTGRIYNIRPNMVGIYFASADGKGVSAESSYGNNLFGIPKGYKWMWTNDVVVSLRSGWNYMKNKVGSTWKPGDTYIKIGNSWQRKEHVYVKVGNTWKLIHG